MLFLLGDREALWRWTPPPWLTDARWLPGSLRRAVAGEQYLLTTRLTPAECVARLRPLLTTSRQPWRWRPLSGVLSGEGFMLLLLGAAHSGSGAFTPHMFGRFVPTESGTHIQVRLALHPLVLIVGGWLFSGGLIFWLIALGRLLVGEPPLGAEPLAWLLGMGILVFAVLFVFIGLWLFEEQLRDSSQLDFLKEVLEAEEVTDDRSPVPQV